MLSSVYLGRSGTAWKRTHALLLERVCAFDACVLLDTPCYCHKRSTQNDHSRVLTQRLPAYSPLISFSCLCVLSPPALLLHWVPSHASACLLFTINHPAIMPAHASPPATHTSWGLLLQGHSNGTSVHQLHCYHTLGRRPVTASEGDGHPSGTGDPKGKVCSCIPKALWRASAAWQSSLWQCCTSHP